MNRLRFFGLVFCFVLSSSFDETVDAKDSVVIRGAGTDLVTNVQSLTDDTPSGLRAFKEEPVLIHPNASSESDHTIAACHGSAVIDKAIRVLLAGNDGFACGQALACNATKQYCYVMLGGPAGVPPSYSCVDVLDISSRPTCKSIPKIGIGCQCAESISGITVTCTAP